MPASPGRRRQEPGDFLAGNILDTAIAGALDGYNLAGRLQQIGEVDSEQCRS